MVEQLDEHSGLAFNLFLGISAAAFLMVLASGIVTSNIVAAVIAGAGLAVIIVVGGTINLVPDSMRSQATERTLSVASNTLRQLRGGLTPAGCEAICALLLPETTARGIAMTDTTHVIAYAGDYVPAIGVGDKNSAPTLEVIASKRIETFASVDSRTSATVTSSRAQDRWGRPSESSRRSWSRTGRWEPSSSIIAEALTSIARRSW